MSTAGHLTTSLGTTWTVVLAIISNETTNTFAFGCLPVGCALAMTIADITILVCLAFHIAFITCVSIFANTF